MKRKRKAQRVVVETKSDTSGKLGARAVTYQRELVTCGKSTCGKLHGPYWYAYWRSAQRALRGPSKVCKRYIGKDFRPLRPDEARKAEQPGLGNKRKARKHA